MMGGKGRLLKNTVRLVNILCVESPHLLPSATPSQPHETLVTDRLQLSEQFTSPLSIHRTGLCQAGDDTEFSWL